MTIEEIKQGYKDRFFSELSEVLDDIFPKTNQDNPGIQSKGNRSGAITLNAFANIMVRRIIDDIFDCIPEERTLGSDPIQKFWDEQWNACRFQLLNNLEEKLK